MRRPIPDHGNVPRRAASTTNMDGQQKRNVIVTSMTNIRRLPRCTSVNIAHAPMRASARAIASSTWKRRTVGPTSDPRTTARARKVMWAKLRRLPRPQHRVLMLRVRNLGLRPARMVMAEISAWRHPSMARRIHSPTQPSTHLIWTSMTNSPHSRSMITNGLSRTRA